MRTHVSLAAAIVSLAVALAACGGGSSTSKTPTAATPGGSDSTPAADATSAGSISGAGADDLKAIVKKFESATFKATYTLSGSSADQFTDGQLVLEKDGAKRIRLDVTGTRDGEKTSITFIDAEDVSVFCLQNAAELAVLLGVDPGQGVCIKNDPNDASNPIGSLSQSLTDFAGENVTVVETSTRSVAGQDGSCYKTQSSDTNTVSTTCFNSDGVILYAETEGDTGSTIEATSVSKSVDSGSFTPPYDVKELPTVSPEDATP